MGLFTRTKKSDGWLAIALSGDAACAVHVRRVSSGTPVVTLATCHAAAADSVEAALEKLARECHADRHQCTTLLSSREYQILSVDSPSVPPAELKTAIRWRLKDLLDYHVDDATIDVLDIPQEKNAPPRSHPMYAIAARSAIIEQRQALFGQARIPLSVIDIPEMAQRNIAALLEPPGRGIALLSFDAEGGLLTFSAGGELYLARHIDVPLAGQSGAEQRDAAFDRITLELQRSLDHFDRQYHYVTLAKLVLAPLGPDGAGLREHLSENLYTPVEALDLDGVLDLSAAPALRQAEQQQRYFLALGAALRIEEKVL
ncbi:agglutinin biogenesis protein MshI [Betaproteobacteria bacterium SCN2]|jgi:MSHA biogenesis protein MshI|nr:agglutinin biogenesis protein MshI [Betaproteobacteria bacterium SCN2]